MSVPRKLVVQVRDSALRVVAKVDTFSEAEVVPKFNPVSLETCGTFMVRLPMRVRDGYGTLRPNPAAARLLEDGAGVTASLDGKRFFTGLVEVPERSRSGSGTEQLEVFGYSDDQLLTVRNAWPVPTSDDIAAQDGQAYDIRKGVAETVAKLYVAANAGIDAPAARRVPGLVVPVSAGLGGPVTGRARFSNLAGLVTDLCAEGGGLGWRVLQVGAEFRFEVFQPRDRSRHARFSPALRNLTGYTLSTPKDKVNRAIVAGGGQGVDRLFNESRVVAPWWAYRETYIDRRDAGGGADQVMTVAERDEVRAELLQSAVEAVAAGQAQASFTAPVQDTPAVGFLRSDNAGGYGPLDLVTVSVDGTSLVQVVRQVSVKADVGGVRVVPTIGVPDQGPVTDLTRRLRDLERRQARIERGL